MNIKKILKISAGVIIFLTLPSLLFFGYIYVKYDEELPVGHRPEQADILAHKMLDALNHEAFENTSYIEWVFKKRRYYKWKKNQNSCTVYWKDYKIELNLKEPNLSTAYVHNFAVDGKMSKDLIEKAMVYFNNDSFWLVAPYKVFDKGTKRSLVTLENGEQGLLVTYTSGGTTPGDSYLWHLDASGKPKSFQMWVSVLPIGGLEASWSDWTTTSSGAQIPSFHKIIFLGIEITDIKGKE